MNIFLNISIYHYLIMSSILFIISILGIFINKNNIIMLFMILEIMLISININFVVFSYYLNNITGQIFVFFILIMTAIESAIGLTILVSIFKNFKIINLKKLMNLKK